jgi:hypothetical protein
MIYELRIYRCVPSRMPALLSRFENKTLRIREKHGIRQAGFWTTLLAQAQQTREGQDDRDMKITLLEIMDKLPQRLRIG